MCHLCGWLKLFLKNAGRQKNKTRSVGLSCQKKSAVNFICCPIVSIIFCQFNGCCVVCYTCHQLYNKRMFHSPKKPSRVCFCLSTRYLFILQHKNASLLNPQYLNGFPPASTSCVASSKTTFSPVRYAALLIITAME